MTAWCMPDANARGAAYFCAAMFIPQLPLQLRGCHAGLVHEGIAAHAALEHGLIGLNLAMPWSRWLCRIFRAEPVPTSAENALGGYRLNRIVPNDGSMRFGEGLIIFAICLLKADRHTFSAVHEDQFFDCSRHVLVRMFKIARFYNHVQSRDLWRREFVPSIFMHMHHIDDCHCCSLANHCDAVGSMNITPDLINKMSFPSVYKN